MNQCTNHDSHVVASFHPEQVWYNATMLQHYKICSCCAENGIITALGIDKNCIFFSPWCTSLFEATYWIHGIGYSRVIWPHHTVTCWIVLQCLSCGAHSTPLHPFFASNIPCNCLSRARHAQMATEPYRYCPTCIYMHRCRHACMALRQSTLLMHWHRLIKFWGVTFQLTIAKSCKIWLQKPYIERLNQPEWVRFVLLPFLLQLQ